MQLTSTRWTNVTVIQYSILQMSARASTALTVEAKCHRSLSLFHHLWMVRVWVKATPCVSAGNDQPGAGVHRSSARLQQCGSFCRGSRKGGRRDLELHPQLPLPTTGYTHTDTHWHTLHMIWLQLTEASTGLHRKWSNCIQTSSIIQRDEHWFCKWCLKKQQRCN